MRSQRLRSASLICCSAIASALSLPVLAEEKVDPIYIKLGAGMAWTSDIEGDFTDSGTKYDGKYSIDDGSFNFNLGIGKEIENWRIEGTFGQNTVETDSITVTSGGNGVTATISPALEFDAKNYHLNLFRDFNKKETFSPYIGLGLGLSTFDFDATTATVAGTEVAFTSENETVFSFTVTGGVSYKINETTALFTEATYLKASEFEIDTTNYDSVTQTSLSGGLRFRF